MRKSSRSNRQTGCAQSLSFGFKRALTLIGSVPVPVPFPSVSLVRKKAAGLESAATIRTKVFVWGLNDKDQLGGLKGSKVRPCGCTCLPAPAGAQRCPCPGGPPMGRPSLLRFTDGLPKVILPRLTGTAKASFGKTSVLGK